MKKVIIALVLGLLHSFAFTQEKLLLEKPGAYQLKYFNSFEQDACNFTKDEKAANYQKLMALLEVLRKNPVIEEPRGFDCIIDKTRGKCIPNADYGITCQIWINFCSWSLEDGKEVCWSNEPPQWYMNVNRLRTLGAAGFNETTDEPSNPKPGFSMEQWEKSADKVNELFYPPEEKEIVQPGLDRYKGDFIVVYNPDRPAYWVHVTIREVFALLYDYWRKHPVQATSEMMVKFLDKEYAVFSESELDGFAYFGDSNSIFRIGKDNTQLPVMHINTAYWNKNLPRSAIQFLSFNYPGNKKYLRSEKERQLSENSGYYHKSRFLEALDLTLFLGVIDR